MMKKICNQILVLTLTLTLAVPPSFAQNHITEAKHRENKEKIYDFLTSKRKESILAGITVATGSSYMIYLLDYSRAYVRASVKYEFTDFRLINDVSRFEKYVLDYFETNRTAAYPNKVQARYPAVNNLLERVRPYFSQTKSKNAFWVRESTEHGAKEILLSPQQFAHTLQSMQMLKVELVPSFMKGLIQIGYKNFVHNMSFSVPVYWKGEGVIMKDLYNTPQGQKLPFMDYAAIHAKEIAGQKILRNVGFAMIIGIVATIAVDQLIGMFKGNDTSLNYNMSPQELVQLAQNDWPEFNRLLDDNPLLTDSMALACDQVIRSEESLNALDAYFASKKIKRD